MTMALPQKFPPSSFTPLSGYNCSCPESCELPRWGDMKVLLSQGFRATSPQSRQPEAQGHGESHECVHDHVRSVGTCLRVPLLPTCIHAVA